jgi:hypothetical protein
MFRKKAPSDFCTFPAYKFLLFSLRHEEYHINNSESFLTSKINIGNFAIQFLDCDINRKAFARYSEG